MGERVRIGYRLKMSLKGVNGSVTIGVGVTLMSNQWHTNLNMLHRIWSILLIYLCILL